MKKVAVVSWNSINNMGDVILGSITEKLINEHVNAEVVHVQIYPQYKDLLKMGIAISPIVANGMIGYAKYICKGSEEYVLRDKAYRLRLHKYYSQLLKDVDAVVYAVGMLKFASQHQSYFFDIINAIALEKNIPVIISGVSVAAPDPKDWRYKQLVRALNNSSVKLITTRDGESGLELLRKYYVKRKDIVLKSIGDPALLLKKYYPVPEQKSEQKKIGLGLIRERIFDDYGGELSRGELTRIYLKIIKVLQKQKVDWVLFSNGMKPDYEFGMKLLDLAGLPSDKLLRNPTDPIELISDISQFDIVIAARLHACIISTALEKPVTGFCWEDKIRCFAKETNQYDYFLEPEELSAENILKNVKRVNNTKKDMERIGQLTQSTVDSFRLIGEIINGT